MNSDPRVGHILNRWQQLRRQGRAPSLEELCADCPELHDAIGRQIKARTAPQSPLVRQVCLAENGRLYMAMYLADSTLAERAAEAGPEGIPQPELLQIFEEAAEALDFLHQRRVLHRDVKPANFLLLRGHAKVADL